MLALIHRVTSYGWYWYVNSQVSTPCKHALEVTQVTYIYRWMQLGSNPPDNLTNEGNLCFFGHGLFDCSDGGWEHHQLEDSWLPFQWGCKMSRYTEVRVMTLGKHTFSKLHVIKKTKKQNQWPEFCFFAGYLKAEITSGTRWWFFTACFCPPVRSAIVWSLCASATMCCLQSQCRTVIDVL